MAPVPGLHLHPPWHPPAPAPGPGGHDGLGDGDGDNGGDDSDDDDGDDDNRDVCYATYPVQMLGSARSKTRTWVSEKPSSSSPLRSSSSPS